MTGTAFNQNTFNAYAYNDRSEVVGGQKYAGTDPNDKSNPVPSYDYDYNYDPIGNRQTFTDSGTQTSYTTNNLNQYSAISTLTDPVHDDDGNMTLMPASSGDWTLEWNAENRLIRAEEKSSPPGRGRVRVEYQYDYMGRRVRKQVFEWDDQADLWSPTADLRYIYDNWNLIAQFSSQVSSLIPDKTYTWGLDLSQSLQGAGGVGGLLSVSDLGPPTSDLWHPTYDANGNVSEYLAPDGTIAAHYEYSPFGQLTAQSGTTPEAFTHRFSTKYLDGETELYYYGFRYYAPELGRWLNRDTSGHLGSTNLYAFVMNCPCLKTDFLGLWWWDSDCKQLNPRVIYKTGWSYTGEAAPDSSYIVGGSMNLLGSSDGTVVIYERTEYEKYCCDCGMMNGYRKFYTSKTVSTPTGAGQFWWVSAPGTWPPGGGGGTFGQLIVELLIDSGLQLPTQPEPGQNETNIEQQANANMPPGQSGGTLGDEYIPECP